MVLAGGISAGEAVSAPILLSAETVATLLDFGEGKRGRLRVYAAGERGQLGPVVRIGRRVRFHAEHIYKLAGARIPNGKGSPSEK